MTDEIKFPASFQLTDKVTPWDQFLLSTVWLQARGKDPVEHPPGLARQERVTRPDKWVAVDDWVASLQELPTAPPEIKEAIRAMGPREFMDLATQDPKVWGVENGQIYLTVTGQMIGYFAAVTLGFVPPPKTEAPE